MSNYYHNFIRSISNMSSTPKKIYTREMEDVYKLNFNNINNYLKIKQSKKDKELLSRIKPIQSITTTELFRSVDKVKKFLPNIVSLVNITEEKKNEVKLFKRNEHQEFEQSFKEEIKNITEKKEKIKNLLSQKRLELQKIDEQISDIKLSINVLKNIKKYPLMLLKNDLKKKIVQKDRGSQIIIPQVDNDISKDDNNNTNNETSNFSFNKLLYRQGQEISKKQKNFAKIKIDRDKLSSDIQKLELEKEDLKNKKEKVVEHLYLYYLDKLKEGIDTRNEGLSWIVKEILSLGKNVLISYFPNYLNDNAIAYIFNQAKIKLLLENYENQIKKLRNELIDLDLLKKKNKKNIKLSLLNNRIKEKAYSESKLKKEFSDYSLRNSPFNLNQNNQNNNNLKINNLNDFSKFNSTARTSFSNTNTNNENILYNTDISFNKDNNKNENKDNNIFIDININNNNDTYTNFGEFSRNKLTNINKKKHINTSTRLLKISPNKLDLSNVNSIPEKLSLIEVKEFLDSTKPKINEKNLGKIKQYFLLNQKIKKTKNMSKDLKKKEMKRIFEEYLNTGFSKKYIEEKEKVLSALIGEDNVMSELSKQKRDTKLYFEYTYGGNKSYY